MATKTNERVNPVPDFTQSLQFAIYLLITLGIGVATYNGSWVLALSVSITSLVIYLIVKSFSPSNLGYATSAVLGLLSSQLCFQMMDYPHVAAVFLIAALCLCFYKEVMVYLPIGIILFLHALVYFFIADAKVSKTLILYLVFFLFEVVLISLFVNWLNKTLLAKTLLEQEFRDLNINLEKNIQYARQIASGNFDSTSGTSENDVLGQSLQEMSKNLKLAAEENRNRNWTMAGVARIAEIIRVSNHKMEDLSNQIISYLVKYLNATQGGIFVIDTSDPDHNTLELKGCYAYDRKKFLERKIEIGEGLVGQAVLEKESIYLIDVPQNYLSITSGLGQANPSAVMIVPLKTEDQVVGAMEIASFNKFEPYQREFLEKVSENIASSIIFTKNQDRTTKLLEDSQVLAEQLRAQEEEVRQNMEELQATQEDLERKNIEMENAQAQLNKERYLIEALMKSSSDSIYFKDLESKFIRVSNSLAAACGTKDPVEMVGKSDFDFFTKEHAMPAYEDEQKIIRTGQSIVDKVERETWGDGRETYVSTTKMPLYDLNGKTIGTFGISRDVTKSKKIEMELSRKEKMFNLILKNSPQIHTVIDKAGKIKYQSPSYFRILELEPKDLSEIMFQEILHRDDVLAIERLIDDVKISGKPAEATFRFKKFNGQWVTMKALIENHLKEEHINSIVITAQPA